MGAKAPHIALYCRLWPAHQCLAYLRSIGIISYNACSVSGLAKAAEILYGDLDGDVDRLYELKQRFIDGVTRIDHVKINGYTGRESAPHVISVSVRGVRSEVLLHALPAAYNRFPPPL